MKFKVYEPCSMNKTLLEKCNLEVEPANQAAGNPTYTQAVMDKKEQEERLAKDFAEQQKATEEFVKENHNKDANSKAPKETGRLKLSEGLFESPVAVEEPATKKRTRGEKEPQDQKLRNQIKGSDRDELYLNVFDELSAFIDNEGEGFDVNKQLKARRGERYEEVYPGPGDYTIEVYGTKPEDFDFARKVADYYGVRCDEPKEDKNPATNSYYKYSMLIRC